MWQFFGRGPRIRERTAESRGTCHGCLWVSVPAELSGLASHCPEALGCSRTDLSPTPHVNPTFSPAHLNLCRCLLDSCWVREEAVREVNLADVFNVGNVFGLAHAIGDTRRELSLPVGQLQPVEMVAAAYMAGEAHRGGSSHGFVLAVARQLRRPRGRTGQDIEQPGGPFCGQRQTWSGPSFTFAALWRSSRMQGPTDSRSAARSSHG